MLGSVFQTWCRRLSSVTSTCLPTFFLKQVFGFYTNLKKLYSSEEVSATCPTSTCVSFFSVLVVGRRVLETKSSSNVSQQCFDVHTFGRVAQKSVSLPQNTATWFTWFTFLYSCHRNNCDVFRNLKDSWVETERWKCDAGLITGIEREIKERGCLWFIVLVKKRKTWTNKNRQFIEEKPSRTRLEIFVTDCAHTPIKTKR